MKYKIYLCQDTRLHLGYVTHKIVSGILSWIGCELNRLSKMDCCEVPSPSPQYLFVNNFLAIGVQTKIYQLKPFQSNLFEVEELVRRTFLLKVCKRNEYTLQTNCNWMNYV